ncbi:MAG TPA: 16S rRNA (adenine(1518)-N(6)/adenine(1519)-N(6))-dimethyltransferase RsmA [Myxococcota bacterium]|nr:16S rRNA (adenine(1518)-N(6)/adenine(1519)-N(6))-dimethyltransferase RsmA [Myxococcota bacterium]
MANARRELAAHGLAPSRARGQNFLRRPELAARIVERLGVSPGDAALEIGPGLGQLTRALAAVARRTLALEVDRGLVALLAREGELPASVELRLGDALAVDLGALAAELGPPVVLVGNLPYSIAGRLLGEVLLPATPFRLIGCMLQRELADRILAAPGSADYGTLSVYARLWFRGERLLELSREEFSPRPKVRSTFLALGPRPTPPGVTDVAVLRRLVRAAFGQRRKQLRRALEREFPQAADALASLGIDPKRRGETLDEAEFAALANALAVAGS